VISDGELVAGGSFTSKAYNTSAIAVSPINMGVVGMPVEFSSQYIHQQLSASSMRIKEPCLSVCLSVNNERVETPD